MPSFNRNRHRILTGGSLAVLSAGWIILQGTDRLFQSVNLLTGADPSLELSKEMAGFVLLFGSIAIALFAFAGWMGSLAYRGFQTGSYPPVRTRVRPDLVIETGRRARVKAIAAVLIALLAGVTAVHLICDIQGIWAIAI